MEPSTSAKSTVTCLRSPSRADFDWRICGEVSRRGGAVSAGGRHAASDGAPTTRHALEAEFGAAGPLGRSRHSATRTAYALEAELAESDCRGRSSRSSSRSPVQPRGRQQARSRRETSRRARSPCHMMRSQRERARIPRRSGAEAVVVVTGRAAHCRADYTTGHKHQNQWRWYGWAG